MNERLQPRDDIAEEPVDRSGERQAKWRRVTVPSLGGVPILREHDPRYADEVQMGQPKVEEDDAMSQAIKVHDNLT